MEVTELQGNGVIRGRKVFHKHVEMSRNEIIWEGIIELYAENDKGVGLCIILWQQVKKTLGQK